MATIPAETQAIIDAFAGRQLFKCEKGNFEGPLTTWTTLSMVSRPTLVLPTLNEASFDRSQD